MYEKAIRVRTVLLAGNCRSGAVGVSAYTLAKIFGVTPQTIHNWIARHGAKLGIASTQENHRKNVKKTLFYIDDNAPVLPENHSDKQLKLWSE